MSPDSILVTGGAGFVGSHLAIRLKEANPAGRVVVLDNLSRRGSELNLPRLRDHEVEFQHGDIRCERDLDAVGEFDLLIDCSAEPSVQAGATSSPRHVLDVNLNGTIHCLEAARRREAAFLFLSTSRVYPIGGLNDLPFEETDTRFELSTSEGVSESFPLLGPRSFYGASKLACELLVTEYVHGYGLKAIVNRCGVIAGPWQMGKVDQGVVTLWVARHHFGRPLRYTGFGGHGKQVRDVLHVDDLFDLVREQMTRPDTWNGDVYNVGGGRPVSTSLRELTDACREVTGNQLDIGGQPETNPLDVRIYLTDTRRVRDAFGWEPRRGLTDIVGDVHDWIRRHESHLRSVLA